MIITRRMHGDKDMKYQRNARRRGLDADAVTSHRHCDFQSQFQLSHMQIVGIVYLHSPAKLLDALLIFFKGKNLY